jgi:hypothetical protein
MASAIHPAPAVTPSVHCGTRTSDRYAPPEPRAGPPEQDGEQPQPQHVVAQRVGRVVVLAHRPQREPRAGPLEEPPHRPYERDPEVDHDVVPEQDRPQDGDVAQHGDVEVLHRRSPHAHVGLPQERGEAQPKSGEREPRRHLFERSHSASTANISDTPRPPAAAPTKPTIAVASTPPPPRSR